MTKTISFMTIKGIDLFSVFCCVIEGTIVDKSSKQGSTVVDYSSCRNSSNS